jgi:hypothetical protein
MHEGRLYRWAIALFWGHLALTVAMWGVGTGGSLLRPLGGAVAWWSLIAAVPVWIAVSVAGGMSLYRGERCRWLVATTLLACAAIAFVLAPPLLSTWTKMLTD